MAAEARCCSSRSSVISHVELTGCVSWGLGKAGSQNTLPLGTSFNTEMVAWKVEVSFSLSAPMRPSPLKGFSTRSCLLSLPCQAAGKEEKGSRRGQWGRFSPDATSLDLMRSVLFQLSVASARIQTRGSGKSTDLSFIGEE